MVRRYKDKKVRRKIRTRAKITRFSDRVRLVVFRSSKHIYGQIINRKSDVLVSASEKDVKVLSKGQFSLGGKQTKTQKAYLVGQILAKKALKKNIKKVVFDRGCFRYHGRVKSLAQGAKKEGLEF